MSKKMAASIKRRKSQQAQKMHQASKPATVIFGTVFVFDSRYHEISVKSKTGFLQGSFALKTAEYEKDLEPARQWETTSEITSLTP